MDCYLLFRDRFGGRGVFDTMARLATSRRPHVNRRTVQWSEAAVAGSVVYFAYAVISTRRWIDREQREHQEAWAEAVLAEQLVTRARPGWADGASSYSLAVVKAACRALLAPTQREGVRLQRCQHTWREVGEALGVSKQAVFQRFGKEWVESTRARLSKVDFKQTVKRFRSRVQTP